MKRVIILLAMLAIFPCKFIMRSTAAGQARAARAAAEDRGITALDQSLREMSNPYTIMFVAAHPADADYGTLAYYRKKLGARVVLALATRGESGDIGVWKAGEDAGVARTRETLEAARVTGADAHFLNLRDFGYSKSDEEALSVWGHEEALRRLVRAIRLHRPDVILMADNAGSGGQRKAIARLVLESFDAATDAKRFPEADSTSWQVRRIFQATDESKADVVTDLNEYNPVRGLTYAQIAVEATGKEMPRAGTSTRPSNRAAAEISKSYYKLVRSSGDEKPSAGSSLLDRLALPEKLLRSIAPPRVGELSAIEAIALNEQLVDALKERLVEIRAEGTAEELRERYGEEFFRVARFIQSIEKSITLALGLSLEIALTDYTLIRGQRLTARLTLRNGGARTLPVAFHIPESLASSNEKPSYKASDVTNLPASGAAVKEIEYTVPKDAMLTLPHSAHLHDESYYPIASALEGSQSREAFGKPMVFIAEIGLDQTPIGIPATVRYDVVPEVEISVTPPFAVVRKWDKPRKVEFTATLRNRTPGPLNGALWVVPLALTEDEYEPVHISFAREDEQALINLTMKLPILKPPLDPNILVEFRREKPAPPDPLGFTTLTIKSGDFEVADGIRVGYISAEGSWLRLALKQMGLEHGEVSMALNSLSDSVKSDSTAPQSRRACGNLAQFDTVIIDNYAYSARPELASFNKCLLDWVEQGGNLVVLSQQFDDWVSLVTFSRIAPFPLKPSSDRIVTETAPVKILDQNHPLVSKPNLIDEKDFKGWIEQLAANIPREWASEYVALTEAGDPGEEANKGGLLVARHGEGTYVYMSYALRPQLQAINPGAYRLLANILSLPKTIKQ